MKAPHKKRIYKKSKKVTKKPHGFTLVELIIVIGIIALLATLAIVSITKVRVQARDAKRTEDARSMVLGLESYYDRNNTYPTIITPGQSLADSQGNVFMAQLPNNPIPHTDGFCPDKNFHYETFNNNQAFILTFCLGEDKGGLKKGINFFSNGSSLVSCGTPITDRDGYIYPTVQLGGQCWLGENLKTKRKPDLTSLTNLSDGSERDCSNTLGVHGTEADCDAGHALYTWNATMNGSSTEGAQGLCMDGWHVPTDADWHTLENFLKNPGQTCNANRVNTFDCDNAGEKLRVGGSANFSGSSPGARYSDILFGDSFNDFDYAMYFWSSSKTGNNVQAYSLNVDETRIWRGPIDVNPLSPLMSLSVRCLKNY